MMKRRTRIHKDMYDPNSIETKIKELTEHLQKTNSELTKISLKIDEKQKEFKDAIDKLNRKVQGEE